MGLKQEIKKRVLSNNWVWAVRKAHDWRRVSIWLDSIEEKSERGKFISIWERIQAVQLPSSDLWTGTGVMAAKPGLLITDRAYIQLCIYSLREGIQLLDAENPNNLSSWCFTRFVGRRCYFSTERCQSIRLSPQSPGYINHWWAAGTWYQQEYLRQLAKESPIAEWMLNG